MKCEYIVDVHAQEQHYGLAQLFGILQVYAMFSLFHFLFFAHIFVEFGDNN